MAKKRVYIHYGCTKEAFDISKIKPVGNMIYGQKPSGCFWASYEKADFGWREWCKSEDDFRICTKDNCLRFTLSDNSKVITINSIEDLDNFRYALGMGKRLDFEKISKHYDAMEVNISKGEGLYFELYGWDCDSICIFNPSIIEIL